MEPVDPLLVHYRSMAGSREQILHSLPKFNEYLVDLEHEMGQIPRKAARIEAIKQDASAVKDTLQLMFDHYEISMAQLRRLESTSSAQKALVMGNIQRAGTLFIKKHRFSLSMLPGKLDMFEDPTKAVPIKQTATQPPQDSFVASLTQRFLPKSEPEKELPLPANLGVLMSNLHVLHEQKSQLEAYLEDARTNRKFSELTTLQTALDEVQAEIDSLKIMCAR